jgi:hypothetical protein
VMHGGTWYRVNRLKWLCHSPAVPLVEILKTKMSLSPGLEGT